MRGLFEEAFELAAADGVLQLAQHDNIEAEGVWAGGVMQVGRAALFPFTRLAIENPHHNRTRAVAKGAVGVDLQA